jgi:Spy/CpxP family protein refolding chaperone
MKATLLCTLTTISTGLLLLSSTPSFAAEGAKESGNRPANIDPEARLAQMKERLKLTDEQVAKMRELGPEKTPEKMAKILEILTPEQREQMKAARENLGAQGREGRENGAPGLPKIDTLKQKLELNESQVAKITPKLDEAHKAFQDVLAQKDLTNEQKREKAKETIGPVMKSIAEELTPEQRTKLREIMPPRPPGEGGARPKKS